MRSARDGLGLLALALHASCAVARERAPLPAEDAAGTAAWTARAPMRTRPTLEEVFLQPALHGTPPHIEGLSPSGRWLLLRWGPRAVEAGAAGTTLRLLDVDHPELSGGRGIPLDELVPRASGTAPDERIGSAAWSPTHDHLALARGRELLLFDPTRGALAELLEIPPVDTQATSELGALVSLAFAYAGAELRFSDRQELYSLPLGEDGWPAAAVPLASARCWSASVEPAALDLDWSDDLETVFGRDPPPARQGEPQAGVDPAPLHVWHPGQAAGATLEGLGDVASLEDARLSPDGRYLAAFELDERATPAHTLIPDYLTERVSVREARSKWADDTATPRTLWIWNTTSGARTAVEPLHAPVAGTTPEDAPRPDPSAAPSPTVTAPTPPTTPAPLAIPGPPASWVGTIGWAPQREQGAPARFAFEVTASDFRTRSIWVWTEGFSQKVFEESDPKWVGGPADYSVWSADGARLIVGSEGASSSTTPGRLQLFAVDPDSGETRQSTEVRGEVRAFQALCDGGVLLQVSQEDPGRTTLARLSGPALHGQGQPAPFAYPTPSGINTNAHAAQLGPRVVFLHEELYRPAEVWVADADGARALTQTTPRDFQDVDWIRPQRLQVESADGSRVRAHVWLPRGLALDDAPPADGARAAIVFIHGAGYLQNVSESMTHYPQNLMFHARLADMGYVVLDVDYRGSSGYGRDFRTDVQGRLGAKELEDIAAAVDELARRGLVDARRVGCYGGSYGGFLTLMALFTEPERWAAGAALRSVTDWRTYAPEYTQPRLGRPSVDAEAYARSSPIDHAEGLADPLLLLHGLVDDNVFAQDTIRLMEKLIDLGKDFDAMLYPSQSHAFSDGPHWLDEYRRIERFLVQHLGPPLAQERDSARLGPR
jgi:dipeptidyl aminopeptidase/acylaminoacyl peptidase